MQPNSASYETIDQYIAMFPKDVQEKLEAVRATIHAAAPEAKEKISYQIPTFTLHGNLVHFAAFKNHIGFYPTGRGVEAFKEELGSYAVTKGTVRFPLSEPLPLDLIARIVRLRVSQNQEPRPRKAKVAQSVQ